MSRIKEHTYSFVDAKTGVIKQSETERLTTLNYIYKNSNDLLIDGFTFDRHLFDVKTDNGEKIYTTYNLYRLKKCNIYALLDESITDRIVAISGHLWWYANNTLKTIYSVSSLFREISNEINTDKPIEFDTFCRSKGYSAIKESDEFVIANPPPPYEYLLNDLHLKILKITGEQVNFSYSYYSEKSCSAYMLQSFNLCNASLYNTHYDGTDYCSTDKPNCTN